MFDYSHTLITTPVSQGKKIQWAVNKNTKFLKGNDIRDYVSDVFPYFILKICSKWEIEKLEAIFMPMND